MYGARVEAPRSSPGHSLKRRQSKSPSPPSKRRAPPSYVPSIYAPVPTSASALPNFHRSLSVEASYGGTPISERSSPGLDWLQRTEDLHLVTPVGTVREEEGRGFGDGDEMMDSEHTQMHQDVMDGPPLPAMPLSRSSTSSPFNPPPAPPHDAPPLHHHLAGSPPMTRSSSSSSSLAGRGGMNATPTGFLGHSADGQILQQPFPPPDSDNQMNEGDNDVSMDSSQQQQQQSQGKGGWKITMGFRSDCEKCQQRIPGHYTHVVYTS
ncbi:uncharacterized protein JCM6883_000662 [Sporobolomyces salmoneus]|uniref:uncharacterized protein n=1 Tax=Sporobolomyces salmoneus TaxID=183962 RepID=UPI003177251A